MTTPTDAGAVDDVKKAKQLTALTTKGDTAELRDLMQLRSFRNFVWNWFAYCGIDDGVFFGDVNDAIYKDGKRASARWVRDKILAIDPDSYTLMVREQHQKVIKRKA